MLERKDSWYSLDWLHSSTDQREVLVEVVVAVGNVESAGCSLANTVHSSKKMVVREGVVVKTESDSKVVGSKIVQTR